MATIIVNTMIDENDGSIADGDVSLRDAIAAANAGDTITFASGAGQAFEGGGTIRLVQALGEMVIASDVTIDGDLDDDGAPDVTITGDTLGDDITTTDPMGNTISDGPATGPGENVNVLNVTGGSSAIDGLVITGGLSASDTAGGVQVAGEAALSITNSSVSGHFGTSAIGNDGILTLAHSVVSSSYGHGISNQGTLTLTDTTLSDNRNDAFPGAGIYNLGTATLTNTTVSDNLGGGIDNGGTASLTNTTVSNNRGSGISNNGNLTLTNTIVEDNQTSIRGGESGGGIRNSGTMTLANTTVSDNVASRGGGISNSGTATLTNTTVSDNDTFGFIAGGIGGGISNRGNLTLTNVTVSGNTANQDDQFPEIFSIGGGIYNRGTAALSNTIVLGNSAANGPEISGTITENGPNLIGGRAADVFAETVDNERVAAGLLADNGGAVPTIALKNDPSNPALNAGQDDRLDESVVGIDLNGDGDTDDVIATDARGDGFERTADLPGVSNNGANAVDLGAFEVQSEDPGGPDLIPLSVTFKAADAYKSNAFGIYDTSTLKAELLEADLKGTTEGTVLYEAELTQQQLDNLGFFLLPDGADANANLADLVGEELTVESTADGYAVSVDGTPLSGRFAPAFFSDASLNPGGVDHFVEDGTAARYALSVEDMAGGGDRDFDDALFEVATGVPLTGAEVTATFESESANFHNTFGYFIEDTGAAAILFADIDETTLAPGTAESFDLTAEASDKLAFFLIPDGATKNANLFADLDALNLTIEEGNAGLQARDQTTDTVLEGFVHPVYVPGKAGNPDAVRHALQIGDVEQFQLRWEDLPGGGDTDYDDTVVSVEITPDELLT